MRPLHTFHLVALAVAGLAALLLAAARARRRMRPRPLQLVLLSGSIERAARAPAGGRLGRAR
jgi:hypothetical protein